MRAHVHLVVPDLFLPHELAAACRDLSLPALEQVLARAKSGRLAVTSLEAWLCQMFGATAIAPVSLQADGIEPGSAYWLRVDPVHLQLLRDQLVVQAGVSPTANEARQFCTSLNEHFSADGLHFIAPHPQRWYLELQQDPQLITRSLPEVVGRDANAHLPQGADAMRWHRLLNEIQMLLFAHPLNHAIEARNELPVNSLWLWGGGYSPTRLLRPFERLVGDSEVAAAFAKVTGIPQAALTDFDAIGKGATLIVWEGLRQALQHGDLYAWRDTVQRLEQDCIQPWLSALRSGRINKITLDVLQENASRRFVLTRGQTWQFWKRSRRLEYHVAEPV